MDRRGETGTSIHASSSPCTVSDLNHISRTHDRLSMLMRDRVGRIYCLLSLLAHTPDNSFLGFVVGSNRNMTTPPAKKNIGLVYGKELYMWQVRGLVVKTIDSHTHYVLFIRHAGKEELYRLSEQVH